MVGHGIDRSCWTRCSRRCARFFALPVAEKRAIERIGNQPLGLLRPRADEERARLEGGIRLRGAALRNVGAALAALRQRPFANTPLAYYEACEALALRLLRIVGDESGRAA